MIDRAEAAARRRKERRMAPVTHGMLFGADAIAAFFRVSRETVLDWAERGAPITRSGKERKRYDVDSAALQKWREVSLNEDDNL